MLLTHYLLSILFCLCLCSSVFCPSLLQCHEMVVRGQLPASEDDLQALAALRLQCLVGDFSTHAPCPSLDELFPAPMLEARVLVSLSTPQALPPCQVAAQGCPTAQRFPADLLAGTLWSHAATAAHKQKVEQDMRLRSRLKEEAATVMGSILDRWKGLAGYSRRDSMAAYLTIARQWSGFGCTLYEVDFYIVSVHSLVLLQEFTVFSSWSHLNLLLPAEFDGELLTEAVAGCRFYISVSVPAGRSRGLGVLSLRPDLLLWHI